MPPLAPLLIFFFWLRPAGEEGRPRTRVLDHSHGGNPPAHWPGRCHKGVMAEHAHVPFPQLASSAFVKPSFATHTHSLSLSHSLTLSLLHSLTLSLLHSLTHSLTHTHPFTHTHSLLHSFTLSLSHSLSHSLTLSLLHSFTPSLTHGCRADEAARGVVRARRPAGRDRHARQLLPRCCRVLQGAV